MAGTVESGSLLDWLRLDRDLGVVLKPMSELVESSQILIDTIEVNGA